MSVLILFLPLLFLWASVWEVFFKILVILFVIIILKTVYFKVTFFFFLVFILKLRSQNISVDMVIGRPFP